MATLPPPNEPRFSFEPDLDFRYYADLLWRSRKLVTVVALGALGLGVLAGEVQTPVYRASTLMQVSPPTPTSLSVTDALVGTGNFMRDRQFFNTQFKVLRSRELGEKVVERLKLSDRPPLKGASDPALAFMSHVSLEAVPESLLIEVRVDHNDPEQAALWANTLADVYIDDALEARVESVKRAYEWLQDRLSETQESLRAANEKLLKSYESQDLVVPEGTVSAVSTSIAKLQEEHVEAQTRRIALEAALKQFGSMRRRGESLDSVPQVAADGLILDLNGQIAALELERSRLQEKYKRAHPELQKVEAQLAQVAKAKDARIAEIEQGLRAEYRQLQGRESELRGALDSQKAQAADQSRKAAELDSLKKEADTVKNLYGVLLQKLSETDIASSVRNDNVRIVQKAWKPTTPVWPRKGQIAGVALLLGLALGIGFVLGRDYLDNTIKAPDEIERYLHLELLAAVPRYDKDSAHLVTEAYQNLRTALLFGRKGDAGQVVLVSGSIPSEGKTTTLVNIGKLLAVSGEKTLVVDGDLRRANLHHRLGLEREPGLTDAFTRQTPVAELIQTTRFRNLFALTAGALPPNPPALLAHPHARELLEEVRGQFRWILLDSPPLASVTDALLLAQLADMAVLVVQHNKVDRKLAKRSVAALRKVEGLNVVGAVLNAVDLETRGYYYYYYPRQGEQKARRKDPGTVGTA